MAAQKKVGFVTIGQSPRHDILAELTPLLPAGVEILEAEALDGLGRKEIEVLAPEAQDFPLISRLRDGSSCTVGRQKILPRLIARVKELEISGADIIAVLCTEDFPELSSRKHLLLPFRLMKAEAEGRQGVEKIFVVVPLKAQEKAARQKWAFPGASLKTAVLNPYAGPKEQEAELDGFLSLIQGFQPDLLIFDCLGFMLSFCQKINEISRIPFLSPRLSLADSLNQLL